MNSAYPNGDFAQPQQQQPYNPQYAQQPPPQALYTVGPDGQTMAPVADPHQQYSQQHPHSGSKGACRICQVADPVDELIRPCLCTGPLAYVHRDCLNRWRAYSPHPDAMYVCEYCGADYKTIFLQKVQNCVKPKAYALVFLEMTFFIAIAMGAWMGIGYLMYLALKPPPFDFMSAWGMWEMLFFWGFVVFFASIGVIGMCVCCCCSLRDKGKDKMKKPYDKNRHSDCYWMWCGPSYYDGRYYGSPCGYWGPTDILCCYLCCVCTDWRWCMFSMNSCGACGGCCDGDMDCGGGDNGGEGMLMLLLVVALVLAVIGVVFGGIVVFLVANKLLKKQLSISERKAAIAYEVIADLDDPQQVSDAMEALEARVLEAGDGPVSPVPKGVTTVRN